MMLEAFDVTEATWHIAVAPPGFATSESPRFVGRAIVAMAADAKRSLWNQQSVTVGDPARHYGFYDLDGSQPDAWAYIAASHADPGVDPNNFR